MVLCKNLGVIYGPFPDNIRHYFKIKSFISREVKNKITFRLSNSCNTNIQDCHILHWETTIVNVYCTIKVIHVCN